MVKWEDGKGSETLYLLTPAEMQQIPDGIMVTDIFNESFAKGSKPMDDDTRGGYLAYGVKNIFHHPDKTVRDLALIFRLGT
jgi:hypothetical protein